jgi:hypothetical protein
MKTVALLALLAASCARTHGVAPPPAVPERRVMDSVPDRIADMPAPVPEADPSNREGRFGIEQNKARREARPRPAAGCVDVVEGKQPPPNPCPKR